MVTCVVPAGVGRGHRIKLRVAGHGEAESAAAQAFDYAGPTVLSISSAGSTTGGGWVSIEGENFGSVPSLISVRLGNSACDSVAVVRSGKLGSDKLACKARRGSGTVRVSVEVAAVAATGTGAGAGPGTRSSVGGFTTTYDKPQLWSIAPAMGRQGTVVTLSGTNFGLQSGDITVSIGGIACTNLGIVSSDYVVSCTVGEAPRGTALGGVRLSVNGQTAEVASTRSSAGEGAITADAAAAAVGFTYNTPCKANQFTDPKDGFKCLSCLKNSESPSDSSQATDCVCVAGYWGPYGGVCTKCPSEAEGVQCKGNQFVVLDGFWTASPHNKPVPCQASSCLSTTFVAVSQSGHGIGGGLLNNGPNSTTVQSGSGAFAGDSPSIVHAAGANTGEHSYVAMTPANTEETVCQGVKKNASSPCGCGYEGYLCGVCSPSYYRIQNHCLPCAGRGSLGAPVAAVTLAVLIVALFYLLPIPASLPDRRRQSVARREQLGDDIDVMPIGRVVIIVYGIQFLSSKMIAAPTWFTPPLPCYSCPRRIPSR